MIISETKRLLEELEKDLERTKDKVIPDSYWEKEQAYIDKLRAEWDAETKLMGMTYKHFHRPFDM